MLTKIPKYCEEFWTKFIQKYGYTLDNKIPCIKDCVIDDINEDYLGNIKNKTFIQTKTGLDNIHRTYSLQKYNNDQHDYCDIDYVSDEGGIFDMTLELSDDASIENFMTNLLQINNKKKHNSNRRIDDTVAQYFKNVQETINEYNYEDPLQLYIRANGKILTGVLCCTNSSYNDKEEESTIGECCDGCYKKTVKIEDLHAIENYSVTLHFLLEVVVHHVDTNLLVVMYDLSMSFNKSQWMTILQTFLKLPIIYVMI